MIQGLQAKNKEDTAHSRKDSGQEKRLTAKVAKNIRGDR